jgi:hypothetical protein
MDIMMPVMDGLEAARRIGADSGGRSRTPLDVPDGDHRPADHDRWPGSGDDFIPKPIDLAILRAKLRAFIRLVQSQRMLREQQPAHRAPQRRHAPRERGRRPRPGTGTGHTELPDGRTSCNTGWCRPPCSAATWCWRGARPAGRLHLLLADAVGHGLPAAINILPLFFPFDGMSRKGCTLATVARELNRRVRDLLPIDRFVAATLVSIDYAEWRVRDLERRQSAGAAARPRRRVSRRIDSMQMALGPQRRQPGTVRAARVACGRGGSCCCVPTASGRTRPSPADVMPAPGHCRGCWRPPRLWQRMDALDSARR